MPQNFDQSPQLKDELDIQELLTLIGEESEQERQAVEYVSSRKLSGHGSFLKETQPEQTPDVKSQDAAPAPVKEKKEKKVKTPAARPEAPAAEKTEDSRAEKTEAPQAHAVKPQAPEEPARQPKAPKKAKAKRSAAREAVPEEKTGEPEAPQKPEKPRHKFVFRLVRGLVALVMVVLCTAATAYLLQTVVFSAGTQKGAGTTGAADVAIMDKFEMFMTNEVSNALEGVLAIEKVYWLSDTDQVAPEPDPEGYGTVSHPSELMWLLEEAAELIDGQEMLFNENIDFWEKEPIYYYYDETILVITWKQIIDRVVYTISEVKIADPSQFRRFLADGTFGSDKQYVTTDMAASVNAVVATSGDFYKFRRNGVMVYEGQLRRTEGHFIDTCFINDQGDLLFAYRDDLTTEEEAQKFIEENGVRFSLCFGPILVDNGVNVAPYSYSLGEINDTYTRAAVCQRGELHYMFVNACGEDGIENRHNIRQFAQELEKMGCDKAYALDGGQTTVIAMDGQLISNPDFGYQRQISDIIYFATAIPSGG